MLNDQNRCAEWFAGNKLYMWESTKGKKKEFRRNTCIGGRGG